jgi:hypothetical protein
MLRGFNGIYRLILGMVSRYRNILMQCFVQGILKKRKLSGNTLIQGYYQMSANTGA